MMSMWLTRSFILTYLHVVFATPDREKVTLPEESSIGTRVADVSRLWRIEQRAPRYLLYSQKLLPSSTGADRPPASSPPQPLQLFAIDETSGAVRVQHRVDRERLCGDMTECNVYLQILAQSLNKVLHLEVKIVDINDNSPAFPSPSQGRFPGDLPGVNVSEAAVIGDLVDIDHWLALDPDIGKNGKVSHTITPNGLFKLVETQDDAGLTHLRLRVTQQLDYERNYVHQLRLTAHDHGMPQRASSTRVRIRILDENDNDPVFQQKEYHVTMRENAAAGEEVATVRATDADSQSQLRYFVSSRDRNHGADFVTVNPVTGRVTLRRQLDREAHGGARILLEARDSGSSNQRVGYAYLVINVTDVNDNEPRVSVTFFMTSHGNKVYLPEHSPPGTNFAYVTASDADAGANGRVRVRIDPSDADARAAFTLTEDGFLGVRGVAGAELDRESRARYDVKLEACDFGVQRRCAHKTIEVALLDVNDHAPVFPRGEVRLMVTENATVGATVARIVASDGDRAARDGQQVFMGPEIVPSTNGDITYSIVDDDGQFAINPQTGDVNLVRTLNRERVATHRFAVVARDNGRPTALESRCNVTVSVGDVNDNAPLFGNPSRDDVTVYATTRRDHVITRVTATDADAGVNGQVSYDIGAEDGRRVTRRDPARLFVVDQISGDLRMNMSYPRLDDQLGTHSLLLIAKDHGKPRRRTTAHLRVIVTDRDVLPAPPSHLGDRAAAATSHYVVVAVASSLFVVVVVVIAAILWCRRNRKQTRTYTCKRDESKEEWQPVVQPSGVLRASTKTPPSRKMSQTTDSSTESDEWRAASYDNRKDGMSGVTHSGSSPLMRGTGQVRRSSSRSLFRPGTSMSGEQRSLSKVMPTPSAQHVALASGAVMTSAGGVMTSHECDSGRGDSDPDAASYSEHAGELGASKLRYVSSRVSSPLVNSQPSSGYNQLGPRCTPACLREGHSDLCWLNLNAQENAQLMTSSSPYKPSPASLYVDLYPLHHQQHHQDHSAMLHRPPPASSDHLAPIPERHIFHPPFSAGTDQLTSIYSPLLIPAPPRPHVVYTPTRGSPASSQLSASKSPRKNFYVAARRDYVGNNATRSSTSLDAVGATQSCHATSPQPTSAFTRSASTDAILRYDVPVSGDGQTTLPDGRNVKAEETVADVVIDDGNVSMRETHEIVANIDKLLTS